MNVDTVVLGNGDVLRRRLSLLEAVGMSISVICPTVTAAFNVTLVAQAVGAAAPLAFLIGTVAMVLVALSFIAFTRRVAHAGSAYGYITHTFGSRAGFVGGWCLLLTYMGFATGQAALVGSFSAAALHGVGVELGSGWIAVALCVSILAQARPEWTQTVASFRPSAESHGWAGLGYAMVFCILSFGGFEGAATLGEETRDPRRAIPAALVLSVLVSGAFFVFVAYCEVVGFGPNGIHDLARSEAPLNDLSLRYVSPRLAIALDLAAAVSCFSGSLGPLAAAARVLFALGRGGLSPSLRRIHPLHGTPAAAVGLAAALVIVPFLAAAPWVGAGNYYSDSATVGTLALILVYIGVGAAQTVESWGEGRAVWAFLCASGVMMLAWVLYRNVYPVPEFPNNLWPYVALAWVMAAGVVMKWRPALTHQALAE